MTAAMALVRRRGAVQEWIAFAIQVAIAVAFEIGDDIARGLISQHGTVEGIDNARKVVAFEAAHGFFFEPAWQMFFLHTRHIFAFTVSWEVVARAMNGVYVLGHVFVTLGVALWVFRYRRKYFRFLRNSVILINGLALIIYENFPVAPPRMTTGLVFDHHRFAFIDTLFGIASSGKAVGTQVGYNEFSAMPSVHVAWALVVGITILFLARPLIVKILAGCYPVLMLIAVVVTGNHFFLDAAGAAGIVAVAVLLALSFEWWRGTFPPPWRRPHSRAQIVPG
jgi:membrane-associated phospholipid phosphatase